MYLHRVGNVALGLSMFVLLAAPGSVTFSQEQTAPSSSPQTLPNDRDLNAFARAYVGLQKIRANYQQSLEKADEPDKKQEIVAEVNGKIASLLEKEGLSAERYNQIFALLNTDEKLRQKTLDLITQERSRSS